VTNRVLMIGGFHEMIDLCRLCDVALEGIVDSNLAGNYLGVPVLGNDEDILHNASRYRDASVILSPDEPAVRRRLASSYAAAGFRFISLISPHATVSPHARLGNGVVVQSWCNVSAGSTIGDFVRLNVGANIMHDCSIGEFTTIAPNAVVLGRVHVGRDNYLGANCTVLPSRRLSHGVVVGAGSVVTRDVSERVTVYGNPARPSTGT
jgi:sugar O-acyltransferase (sialic acid O-acetyltransferase NeuD family)